MIKNVLLFGVLRLIPALGMLLFTLLTVRLLDENDASEIVLYTAALYLLGFLGRGGVDLYALKKISVLFENNKQQAKSLFLRASREVFIVSVVISVVVFSYFEVVRNSSHGVLYLILPVFSVLSLNSMVLRAVKYEYRGVVLEAGTASLMASLFMLICSFNYGYLSLYLVYIFYFISLCIILLIQLYLLFYTVEWESDRKRSFLMQSGPPIMLMSWKYSVVNVCSYLILWLPVFFISKISSLAVIIMAVAIRLSSVPGFLVSTIDTMVAPKVARMYAAHQLADLDDYLYALRKHLIIVAVLLIVGCYPVFYAIEKLFLSSESSGASWLAYVIVLSHAVSLYLGPVGYVLLMTGYESIQKNLKIYMLLMVAVGGGLIVLVIKDTYIACLLMVGLIAVTRILPNIIMARKVKGILKV